MALKKKKKPLKWYQNLSFEWETLTVCRLDRWLLKVPTQGPETGVNMEHLHISHNTAFSHVMSCHSACLHSATSPSWQTGPGLTLFFLMSWSNMFQLSKFQYLMYTLRKFHYDKRSLCIYRHTCWDIGTRITTEISIYLKCQRSSRA